MLTKQDIQLLKDVFATKDDLGAMEARQDKKFATKDDLGAMEARQDKKFATKDDLSNLLRQVKVLLDRQTKEIHADIGQLLEDAINPLLDHHDKRITRLEKHVKLPPMPFVSSS